MRRCKDILFRYLTSHIEIMKVDHFIRIGLTRYEGNKICKFIRKINKEDLIKWKNYILMMNH